MAASGYALSIRVELLECDLNGSPMYGSGALRVEENFRVRASDFLALAKILGKFHDLNEELRKEHGSAS